MAEIKPLSEADQKTIWNKWFAGNTDKRNDLDWYIVQCALRGIDPMSGTIIPTWYGQGDRRRMTLIVTAEAMLKIAESTGHYSGQEGPFWCGEDGVWKDVWLDSKPPAAAKVCVLREDFSAPMSHVCLLRDYTTGSGMWKNMPSVMLAKCAMVGALRRAFPQAGGLYTREEMDQAGTPKVGGTVQEDPPVSQPRPSRAAAIVESTPPMPNDSPPEDPEPEPQPEPDAVDTIPGNAREAALIKSLNNIKSSIEDLRTDLQESDDWSGADWANETPALWPWDEDLENWIRNWLHQEKAAMAANSAG